MRVFDTVLLPLNLVVEEKFGRGVLGNLHGQGSFALFASMMEVGFWIFLAVGGGGLVH